MVTCNDQRLVIFRPTWDVNFTFMSRIVLKVTNILSKHVAM